MGIGIGIETPTENFEKEFLPEKPEDLADEESSSAFYRGVPVKDALKAIFGNLELKTEDENSPIGNHDNVSLNLDEAITFSPSSETIKGKKFSCVIGFSPLNETKIDPSYLGKNTFFRVNGKILAKQIIVRFAGNKPGQPAKRIKYFSPKDFYKWVSENFAA